MRNMVKANFISHLFSLRVLLWDITVNAPKYSFRVIIRSVYTFQFACRNKNDWAFKSKKNIWAEHSICLIVIPWSTARECPSERFRKGFHFTNQTKTPQLSTLSLQTYVFIKRAECNIEVSDHEHAPDEYFSWRYRLP